MEKEHSNQVVKAKDEVIGVEVKDASREDLGKIEEIVLDKKSGETRYVVLSFGGILGLGDKLFALPWHTLSYSAPEKCFILNTPREKLDKAPGFEKENWPNMADLSWAESIESHYKSASSADDLI